MNDLSLIPTVDLINEIQKRFDHFVVVGRKYTKFNTGDFVEIKRYNGNRVVCIGMVEAIKTGLCLEECSSIIPIKNEEV